MDWNLAIEKNTQALTQIVAGLFVLVGIVPNSVESQKPTTPSSSGLTRGSTHKQANETTECAANFSNGLVMDSRIKSDYDEDREADCDNGTGVHASTLRDAAPQGEEIYTITFGPITRRHLISVLRTAEAALRRLIVLFVNVHGVKATAPKTRIGPLPDFSTFGQGQSDRPPVFNLFDPRKRVCLISDDTSVPSSAHAQASRLVASSGAATEGGQTDLGSLIGGSLPPSAAEQTLRVSAVQLVSGREPDGEAESKQSAEKLLKRLAALDHALKTLPQQAKRLVRIMAQREKAPAGIKRIPPIRPGIPPGFRDRGKHEVDDVLRECHGLMRDWKVAEP